MKKIISLVLALVMCLSLCACGNSKAVKNVEEMIASIGEVSIYSGDAILSAKEAYEQLSVKDRKRVDNSKILEEAISRYSFLESEKDRLDTMLVDATNILFVDFNYELACQKWDEVLALATDLGDVESIEEATRMIDALPFCCYENTPIMKLEYVVSGTKDYFVKSFVEGNWVKNQYNLPTGNMLNDVLNEYLDYMDTYFEIGTKKTGHFEYKSEDGYTIRILAAQFIQDNLFHVEYEEDMVK